MDIRQEIARTLEHCSLTSNAEAIDEISLVFVPERTDAKLLDPNVLDGGGRAVLLRDLFSLQDVLGALGDAALSILMGKDVVAGMLKRLIKSYSKYRQVSVEIDEVEFSVMLAVKRGAYTVDAIMIACSQTQGKVQAAVASLCSKKTNTGVSLLFTDSTGKIRTEF